MPHSHPRDQHGANLEADLVDRVRETAEGRPAVEIAVATAHGSDAELRSRQLAAIVRLLRHAVEINRRAA